MSVINILCLYNSLKFVSLAAQTESEFNQSLDWHIMCSFPIYFFVKALSQLQSVETLTEIDSIK